MLYLEVQKPSTLAFLEACLSGFRDGDEVIVKE